MEYEIKVENPLDILYDEAQIRRAKIILDNICESLHHGFYMEGRRNDTAVDLCCVCHVLGLDPLKVAEIAWEGSYCSTPNSRRYDLQHRVEIINDYLDSWDRETDGVFDKMIYCWNWDECGWVEIA